MLESAVPPAAREILRRTTYALHDLAPQGPKIALPELDLAIAGLIEVRARGDLTSVEYTEVARELIGTARGLRLIDEEEFVSRSFAAGLPG